MSLLQQYGWNTHFENIYSLQQSKDLQFGRVVAIKGFNHTLISLSGTTDALLSGALLNGRENSEHPKVGDWVVFKAYEEQGIIVDILRRQNELSRKLPGKSSEIQVLAANIDAAFILQGLDRDFNLMRLQRYLQQVIQCKIQPIIILNKKDLVNEPDTYLQQVHDLGFQCPVVLASALDRQSLQETIAPLLHAGKTYILLGSSGAGKSTLLNALLGYQLQPEGTLSAANSKGRHTTTTRNLEMLTNGSMIIDSPGMREFGVTMDADDTVFIHPQIAELSANCRFRDCTHQHEPGCAVVAAVESGELPLLVFRSFQKLTREQYHFQTNALDKKRMEHHWGRISKQVNAYRKKRKY